MPKRKDCGYCGNLGIIGSCPGCGRRRRVGVARGPRAGADRTPPELARARARAAASPGLQAAAAAGAAFVWTPNGRASMNKSQPFSPFSQAQRATLRAVAAGRPVFESCPEARALVRRGQLAWKGRQADAGGAPLPRTRTSAVAELTPAGRSYLIKHGVRVPARVPLSGWTRGRTGWYLILGVFALRAFREPTGTWCYGFFGAAEFTRVRDTRDRVLIRAEDYAAEHLDAARAKLRAHEPPAPPVLAGRYNWEP